MRIKAYTEMKVHFTINKIKVMNVIIEIKEKIKSNPKIVLN